MDLAEAPEEETLVEIPAAVVTLAVLEEIPVGILAAAVALAEDPVVDLT